MAKPHISTALLACAFAVASQIAAAQAVVRATPLLSVGDALAGSTVSALNPVFTDGIGTPGALVSLASGARVVWSNGNVLFNSSTVASPVLVGGEAAMGFGNGGRFAYSPAADGNDSIYTQNGVLLAETQPIPGIVGLFSSFNSRPNMLPDGRAFWVGGFTATAGGATQGRILLRASTVGPSVFESLLRSGDLVNGFAVNTVGIGFGVAMSDDGNQLGTLLILDTGSTLNDSVVRINTDVVAREGDPVGVSAPGENWQAFAGLSINNAGRWLLAGDTDVATAADAFLASNGVLQVREGGVIDGETLDTPAAVRAASVNNRGEAVHVWNANNIRKAFYAPDAAQLGQSRLIARTGSLLDLNADGISDATLVDILGTFTSVSAVNLAEDGFVYLHASYTEGANTRESLLRIGLDAVFANGFEAN